MNLITKKCETCNGHGIVKVDELGEVHNIEKNRVYSQEFGYLKLKESICPDCEGLGEIDITDDVEDDIAYMQRKERQNEN